MSIYAIGDVQGCFDTFLALLEKINFDKTHDLIYLVGDLINRGNQSLEMLQFAYDNQNSIKVLLGNHDIYLLARYNNICNTDKDDNLYKILNNKNIVKLINYLRTCPLIYQVHNNIFLAHAGIYPQIELAELMFLHNNIMQYLQMHDYQKFIVDIYGNKPNKWQNNLNLTQKMKFVTNSCTRMRYLNKNFALNYTRKEYNQNFDKLIPWFNVPCHQSQQDIIKKIIFGHWSSLGLYQTDKFIGIDTGCVRGNLLTAVNLDTFEIIQTHNIQ